MFWLNYRANALTGFHTCVVRSEVTVVFTTGEGGCVELELAGEFAATVLLCQLSYMLP
jgi:hypothetical protein